MPSTRGLMPYQLTGGKIAVILRVRLLQPYGACGGDLGWGDTCHQPMLKLRDVRYLLRAAIQWDRRGGNTRSEYDAC
ncbi:MAG: hypothetical protein GY838_12980 [bacterium]|nr:hypothetical protein [bacterium]